MGDKNFIDPITDIVAENLKHNQIQTRLNSIAESWVDGNIQTTIICDPQIPANLLSHAQKTIYLNEELLMRVKVDTSYYGEDITSKIKIDASFFLMTANNMVGDQGSILISGVVGECRLMYDNAVEPKRMELDLEQFQIRQDLGNKMTKQQTVVDIISKFSGLPARVTYEGITFSPSIFINGENDVRLVYDVVDVSEDSPHRHNWKEFGCWYNPFNGLDKETGGKPCGFLFLIENIFNDGSMLTAIEETIAFLDRNKSEILQF